MIKTLNIFDADRKQRSLFFLYQNITNLTFSKVNNLMAISIKTYTYIRNNPFLADDI